MRIIKRVLRNKTNEQLSITLPKGCDLKQGDYVEIIKVPERKNVQSSKM